jgi:tripartite-type tricarboxylate transporter receptor subunit TctC
MRKVIGLVVLAAVLWSAPVAAQSYPNRLIRIVVPFTAGGSTDVLARRLGEKMAQSMGQPVIVENRPGAGGTVGSDFVAKAPADGYTLLMGVTGTHGISVSLYQKLPYHPLKSFEPISMVVRAPLVLVTGPAIPAANLKEFVAFAAAKPGDVTHSSPGNGTSMHLTGEMFNIATHTQLVHVPYRGSAGAVNDLIAGHVQSMFGDILVVLPFVQNQQIKALAVTSAVRHPLLPEVPTVAEQGYPGFEALSWQGLFAPAGTPPEMVAKLNAETVKALESPDIKDFFARQGFLVGGSTPEGFRAFIEAEIPNWAEVIREGKVTVQ